MLFNIQGSISSRLRAAKLIEPNLPIEIIDSTFSGGQPPPAEIVDHCLRTVIQFRRPEKIY
jgi:hypothetical protein